MAAVFLVTLYEYSPLFYICVVSLCFVVTAAMVLGWFGFDVPVILRSYEENESIIPTPEKQMVQVTNPFTLELGSGPASVTGCYNISKHAFADGVSVRPGCLEPCVLTCFWGCEVSALQGALQAHQHGPRLSNPQRFQEALHHRFHYCQSFHIGRDDREERHAQIPADQEITDFGPLPRQHYPLVAVLTVEEAKATDVYNIVASVTVIHIPDERYNLSARVLFQYLLTSQGNMYELKIMRYLEAAFRCPSHSHYMDIRSAPLDLNIVRTTPNDTKVIWPLFMSAGSGPHNSEQNPEPSESNEEAGGAERSPALDDEDWSEGTDKDCVVCQNATVNRVLLPCRHACACDSCVSHVQHCPICRAFIVESFVLTRQAAAAAAEEQ